MKAKADPEPLAEDAELGARVRGRLLRAILLTTALGAVLVFAFAGFLLPASIPKSDSARLRTVGAIVGAVYLPAAILVGNWWARRATESTWDWLEAGRAPNPDQRDRALRTPLLLTAIAATFWALAALVFGLIQLDYSFKLGVTVFDSVLLGGVTTCALGYLLTESIWRPVVARALAGDPPSRPVTPGIRARLTMAWALATGVPLIGIFAVASSGLLGADIGRLSLWATMFLAVMAICSGILATRLVARSVADPIASVRSALARVEQGELQTGVSVYDGSEIGLLQAGFNRMADGLRERERLREIFGRHVGREVARVAVEGEVELGGEEREVAALFVDLVGSTALANRLDPGEVVDLLNSFFAIVVATVEEHGGWVNKFEGDAALCVFGAPVTRTDPAGDALCAARNLRDRLRRDLPVLDAGIGVSAGRAVAGNIGAEERYEYTVIGDPVNEAARLCELAKQKPERLLASEAAVELVAGPEVTQWTLGEDIVLRGRNAATKLATAAFPD
jgi:adenylate cyclase